MEKTKCVLDENKECDGCMECEICDNCGKCLEIKDYAAIKIDRVYTDPDDYHEN